MRSCVSTNPALESDGLAGDAALEGAEDELVRRSGVEDVEASPVYAV